MRLRAPQGSQKTKTTTKKKEKHAAGMEPDKRWPGVIVFNELDCVQKNHGGPDRHSKMSVQQDKKNEANKTTKNENRGSEIHQGIANNWRSIFRRPQTGLDAFFMISLSDFHWHRAAPRPEALKGGRGQTLQLAKLFPYQGRGVTGGRGYRAKFIRR